LAFTFNDNDDVEHDELDEHDEEVVVEEAEVEEG